METTTLRSGIESKECAGKGLVRCPIAPTANCLSDTTRGWNVASGNSNAHLRIGMLPLRVWSRPLLDYISDGITAVSTAAIKIARRLHS